MKKFISILLLTINNLVYADEVYKKQDVSIELLIIEPIVVIQDNKNYIIQAGKRKWETDDILPQDDRDYIIGFYDYQYDWYVYLKCKKFKAVEFRKKK